MPSSGDGAGTGRGSAPLFRPVASPICPDNVQSDTIKSPARKAFSSLQFRSFLGRQAAGQRGASAGSRDHGAKEATTELISAPGGRLLQHVSQDNIFQTGFLLHGYWKDGTAATGCTTFVQQCPKQKEKKEAGWYSGCISMKGNVQVFKRWFIHRLGPLFQQELYRDEC